MISQESGRQNYFLQVYFSKKAQPKQSMNGCKKHFGAQQLSQTDLESENEKRGLNKRF